MIRNLGNRIVNNYLIRIDNGYILIDTGYKSSYHAVHSPVFFGGFPFFYDIDLSDRFGLDFFRYNTYFC